MQLEPHQQRVVDEKRDLDGKREKLGAFKNTDTFTRLPWQEQERLNTQAHLMTMYSAVLGERIAAFQPQVLTEADAGADLAGAPRPDHATA